MPIERITLFTGEFPEKNRSPIIGICGDSSIPPKNAVSRSLLRRLTLIANAIVCKEDLFGELDNLVSI
jgi:hypothetical protein